MCLKFNSCLSIIHTIVVYTNSGEWMGTGMELIIFLVSGVKSTGLSNRIVKESIPTFPNPMLSYIMLWASGCSEVCCLCGCVSVMLDLLFSWPCLLRSPRANHFLSDYYETSSNVLPVSLHAF